MRKLTILLSTLLCGFFSCNSVNDSSSAPGLDHTQAKALVTKALGLPISYVHCANKKKGICWGNDLRAFQDKGLIDLWDDANDIRKFYVKVAVTFKDEGFRETETAYEFDLYKLIVHSITGVSFNQSTQVATVRFMLKATNITPFAYALENVTSGCSGINYIPFNLVDPFEGEMTFKKFDTGWKIDGVMANMSEMQRRKMVINKSVGNH